MSDEETPTYTVDLNGKRYELNEDARRAIQERAQREYEGNYQFSCWWKTARRDDYSDEEWEENVHEEGDPVLVIETEGPMAPWERLDKLEVEMGDPPESDSDDSDETRENDAGNGMKTLPPDAAGDGSEDEEFEIGRTHFDITPNSYEELPSPQGEDEGKVPVKPERFDEPTMVKWIPDHPDIEHTWAAGEAIASMHNWVEWNVQQYANQPRPHEDGENRHDRWESVLSLHDCEVVGSWETNQDVPKKSGSQDSEEEKEDIGGKYGGNNWQI